MKTTQKLIACALFTCLLAVSAAAGDMHNPGRIVAPPTIASDSYPKAKNKTSSRGDNALDLMIQVALFFHKNIATAM